MTVSYTHLDVYKRQAYDYSACLYPEGMLNSKDVVLFNHDQIQMIYFIGFQDIEELHFRSLLKNSAE